MGDEAVASAERQILNLLHRYAERVDDGDFDGVAELFADADYLMAGPGQPALRGAAVADTMRRVVRCYDGRPRTKHVVTNTILELDEAAGTAAARSYFTVLQATPALPLQPIVTGRYLDRFVREGTAWRFAERTIVIEQVGDLSHHLAPGTL
jgi:3-phenylpropionate/cinnamic acid dioxygenase small subunit